MKKGYILIGIIACILSLVYVPLPAIFDRGSIMQVPLVNEDKYYQAGLKTQQDAQDARQNPYNNPNLLPENEDMNGQMRYVPHAIELLRPALQ